MAEAIPREVEVVICGAGISGIATAYFLAVEQGITNVLLIDKGSPLSLTSDKSTECYRNWWPGPGDAMVALMNRSISLMEDMASKNGNLFQMNQRGYLYVSKSEESVANLRTAAEEAAQLGAGKLRIHLEYPSDYQPHLDDGLASNLDGADLIMSQEVIQHHFPYLSEEVIAVLHVRRAGWLSAQQFGMWMLEEAKRVGVKYLQSSVTAIETSSNKVISVELNDEESVNCTHFVNAAGPFAAEIASLLNTQLPVHNELHLKSSIEDSRAVLDRSAPLVIFAEPQRIDWTKEETAYLKEDSEASWLLNKLPMGAHTRPEGSSEAQSILLLWDTRERRSETIFPIDVDPMEAETALRGLIEIIPGFRSYLNKMPKPTIDGGYYTKTEENRPLASPMSIEGTHFIGASSGYGIMAAAALGELMAAHISGNNLPSYSAAFHLNRYQDPQYIELLKTWGAKWQL
jgi:glycine/D-amino acid oxidase-like deaminating enzyme